MPISRRRALTVNASTPVTVHPGTYYGGLKITGSGSVTFEPGTYIFAGGGFSFWNRMAIRLAGTGVTLVNRGSLLPDLKTSREEGQPNFVNPGLRLASSDARSSRWGMGRAR